MEDLILNCAVVDDSSLQRLALVKLINNHANLMVTEEYGNAIAAKNGLLHAPVDLLFIDIEMPIISGFDLLDDLVQKPQIIFVSGKTKYAYKAFNYNALDYLQKPVTRERFLNAIHKAISLHRLMTEGSVELDDYIFVKSNFAKKKIFLNDLKYIEALGDYVKLVTYNGPVVVLSTMKAFEERLPTQRFMRIHKSYIVNLEKVNKFNSHTIEIEGEKIPLSRYKKSKFMEILAV